MRRLILILVAALLLATVAGWIAWHQHAFNASKVAHPVEVAAFESDMTEALLRDIFQEFQTDNPPAFFLAFGESLTAPSARFLARFHDVQPPVRNFTHSVLPPNGQVIDRASGRAGVLIRIVALKQSLPDQFEAEVAVTSPIARWRFATFRLTSQGGDWNIRTLFRRR